MKVFKKLLKSYYRLFYFFFKIEKKDGLGREYTDSLAAIAAIIPMVVLCFCNVCTILYIIARFVVTFSPPSDTFFIIIVVIDVGLNGWLFLHKKRYMQIKEMFQGENEEQRLGRSFLCLVFSIASLFTMIVLIALFGLPWAK